MCVCFLPIHSGHQVRRTYQPGWGHTGGRSHRIFHPPSFCGACLNFSTSKAGRPGTSVGNLPNLLTRWDVSSNPGNWDFSSPKKKKKKKNAQQVEND